MSPDDIQEAYLRRAIAEIGHLNDEITGCARCRPADVLPVMGSGSPQAEIFMVKWAATPAEREEGVAFFGRSGTAVLKSVQRLGIDPLGLYGTLCVKCGHQGAEAAARDCPAWLLRELAIVMPKLVVVMGERALEAVNALGQPLAEPLRHELGTIQQWTPTVEALVVPDIDESLDEQGAKRRFWSAFRVLGDWHDRQAPF
ncbi:MAG: uracil-DNA glycosylase family protein [Actinomycetota bacterium]